MLTDADVLKMQRLYKTKFGISLSRDDAYSKLSLLVRQMELTYQSITRKQLKDLHDKDKAKYIDGDKNGKLTSTK
jgi:hypothetical protein